MAPWRTAELVSVEFKTTDAVDSAAWTTAVEVIMLAVLR